MASGQKTQWPDFVWIMGPVQKPGLIRDVQKVVGSARRNRPYQDFLWFHLVISHGTDTRRRLLSPTRRKSGRALHVMLAAWCC